MTRPHVRSRRISIRTLLALMMGGLVTIATVAVLWVALGASTRNTFELLNDRVVLILDGIEGEVRDKLDKAAGLVEGVGREMQTDHFRAIAPAEILDTFTVLLATAEEVEVLLYWDRTFLRRGVARRPDGSYFRLQPEIEVDPRVRDRLGRVAGGVPYVWGSPVVEGGVTFLNVVSRVGSAGANASDVAYVGAAVSLDQFSRFVASIGASYDATAFILYGEDRLLAHPDLAGGADGRRGIGVIPISEADDPVIAGLPDAVPAEFVNIGRSRQGSNGDRRTRVERLAVDGTDYLVLLRAVEGYGSEPITIGAYYRQSQFGDAVERLMMSGILGVVIAIVAVVSAIVLGRLISKPVGRLSDSAGAIGRLEVSAAPRPPGSFIAELDDQAKAFNLMLDGLKVFESYVPRQLVQRLIALGGEDGVASETREVTVMFTDIVGFTTISDRMGAEETAAFLNRHFGLLADCIRAEGGSIDKYIGDAVMAFWGAPDRMDDHAERAVAAARRIARTVTSDNWRRARKGLEPVRIRVGLHTGKVVVGNIGARDRVNYTIVGDTVNVAQRLEVLGHTLDDGADVTVLMSAETAKRAGVGADGEDVGAYALAGVPDAVPVVRLHTHLQPAVAGVPPPAVPAG